MALPTGDTTTMRSGSNKNKNNNNDDGNNSIKNADNLDAMSELAVGQMCFDRELRVREMSHFNLQYLSAQSVGSAMWPAHSEKESRQGREV
ncbi:unnamed protein product [Protopolystoma xenopodis]|uniref:Uncharacterized protein n=1 Tax=Protopolystoma xenopodis TaxID=117903 RepID=A0A448XLM3_9PLAT|nr:unnamed protein product [Protopolystoma xenopodis]